MSALRKAWPFQRPLGDSFRVVGVTQDRRNKAQLCTYAAIEQERADMKLEREWREASEQRRMEIIEARLQAERPEDPESEFSSWQDEAADAAGVPRFGEI